MSSSLAKRNQEKPARMGRLFELERVIAAGLQSFIEVGNALMEIRDKRLYKEQGYKNFEEYCHERWKWGRNYANKQIKAAKVAGVLGTVVPKSERVARELADQPEGVVREVAERVDLSRATAREVRAAVTTITGAATKAEPRGLAGLRRAWDSASEEARWEFLEFVLRCTSEGRPYIFRHEPEGES